MQSTSHRRAGAAIAIFAAIMAVAGITVFHLGIPFAGAIAVIGIALGTGVARGKFSNTKDTGKQS